MVCFLFRCAGRPGLWAAAIGLIGCPVTAQTPNPQTSSTVPAKIVVKPADPPATSGPLVAPDPLQDGMVPMSGQVAWPTVEATTAGDTSEASADVRYTVEVDGLGPLGLQDSYRQQSSLWTKKGQPANLAQINRRVTEDRDLIDQLMRSVGFYGGATTVLITYPAKAGEAVKVALTVVAGPRYRFDAVTLDTPPGATAAAGEFAVKAGDPVDAARVQAEVAALPLKLSEAGYPFPKVGEPVITVDHASRTAQLVLSVDPGPRGVFGAVRFAEPTSRFSNDHLAMLARLRRGDRYNATDLEDLRRAMIQTGLFGSVAIKPVAEGGAAPGGAQYIDLVVSVEGAPLKTVSAAAGYSTGQGPRIEASWQNRNFFKPEGALTLRAVGAETEQLLSAEVRRRNFRKRDQTLILHAEGSYETVDPYKATSFDLSAAIERETNIIWQKKWTYSLGTELLFTRQTDRSAPGDPNRTFFIAALPGNLTYDGSDSLLDPASGFRLTGRFSPEVSVNGGTTLAYAKTQIEGSVYLPFGNIVLAARGHLGSIVGASRGRIAPSRRFYAGGGGSVRGFSYQGVGPKDATNTPLGGNSIVETSFEARFRFKAFGNDIGLVPFIDAGQVYTSTLPKFNSLKVGAGVGLRYYTSFGPIRVDVARAVTKAVGDPAFGVYVSIGQAF